jgi:hypothetical protein
MYAAAERAMENAHALVQHYGDLAHMIAAFHMPGDEGLILMSLPMTEEDAGKDVVAHLIRGVADELGVDMVTLAVGAWLSMIPAHEAKAPHVRPSEDPGRQEVVIVTASHRTLGAALLIDALKREGDSIRFEEIERQRISHAGGRFAGILDPGRDPVPAPLLSRVREIASELRAQRARVDERAQGLSQSATLH